MRLLVPGVGTGVRAWLRLPALIVACALMATGLQTAPRTAEAAVPARCYPTVPMSSGLFHSVVLGPDGTAWASGENHSGALGSSGPHASAPRQVTEVSGLVTAASGARFTLALDADGAVWSWGSNIYGNLGDGTTVDRVSPTRVSGLRDVTAVAAGSGHSLAVESEGTAWAWGNNSYGQLGNGSSSNRTVPVQVTGLTGVVAVAGGANHSLALDGDGRVWAWGDNFYGQLGTGDYQERAEPVQVPGLGSVVAVAAGWSHSIALRSNGTVWAWGSNNRGQLGIGAYTWDEPSPKQVTSLSEVTAIATAMTDHASYALHESGNVYAWGGGWNGELGTGQFETRTHTRVEVLLPSDAQSVADGPVVLRSNGTLWAWGQNDFDPGGRLGDGSTDNRAKPVQMLNVNQAPPKAPTELTAVAGERLAYLTWERPASVVTQYAITPYVGAQAQDQLATGSPRDADAVQGLNEGTTYSFEVAAQNCLGTSPVSDRSNNTIPTGVQLGEKGFKIEGTELTDRLTLNVNAFNGNVALHAADLRIAGTGLDLHLTRTYNNRSPDTDSPWGAKWSASVGDVRLEHLTGGSVLFHGPGGAQLGFPKNDDGTFEPPAGINATLVLDDAGTPTDGSDDTYVLTENATYERLTFDATGKLLEARDRNDNTMTYVYGGPGGTLSAITDTMGRTTAIAYNAQDRVQKITDPASRTHTYDYDAVGNLTVHTDPAGGVTTFAYDADDNLTSVVTPAGRRVDLAYDGSGRVTSQKWPLAFGTPTTTFTYSTPTPNESRTVVRDPNGNETTYTFDPPGRTTGVTDALGNAASLEYTSRSNIRRHTAPGGGTTSLGYTSVHALSSVQAPTGAEDNLAYDDPDHPHLPTRVTDPQGNDTTFAYDVDGNLVSQESELPAENRVELDYNSDGTVAEVTDPRGNATTYTYDAQGNPSKTSPPAPLGEVSITYDAISRVTSVTDGQGQQTTFDYDPLDRVTVIAYADGSSLTYEYDPDGNLVRTTDPTGVTTMTYDAIGQLVSRKATERDEVVSYGYDKGGNLTSVTVDWQSPGCASWGLCSGRDQTYSVGYTYNKVNLPTKAVADGQEIAFTYDADYNRASIASPNGITQTFDHDEAGRVTRLAVLRHGKTLRSLAYSYDRDQDDTALRHSVVEERLDPQPTSRSGAGVIPYTFGAGHSGDRFSVFQLTLQGTLVFEGRPLAMEVFCDQDCLVGERQQTSSLGEDSGIIHSAWMDSGALGVTSGTVVDPQTGQTGSIQLSGWDGEGIGTYSTVKAALDTWVWRATVTVDAEVCLPGCSTQPVTLRIEAGMVLGGGAYTQVTDPDEPSPSASWTRSASYDYDALNRLTRSTTEVSSGTEPSDPDPTGLLVEDTYTYDGAGNRLSRLRVAEDATGTRTTRSEEGTYDAADELSELTTRLGTDPGADAEVTREEFAYDASGNLTASSRGAALAYSASRQTTSIRPAAGRGRPAAFTYRGAGQTERLSTALRETPAPPGGTPPARFSHAMAYDADRRETVLFGGDDASGNPLDDTWTWDGEAWTPRHPRTAPPAMTEHTMAYDAARGEVVLFGGWPAQTWVWDGDTWTEKDPPSSPSDRKRHAMAYDAAREEVVLYGGTSGGSETWVWDGDTWTEKTPPTSPPRRRRHAMAFDAARDEVVLFGGGTSWDGAGDSTWVWDGDTWTQRTPPTKPPERGEHAMAYDAVRQEVVLFGGHKSVWRPLVDTWVWDGTDWVERVPDTMLGVGLAEHGMVFDAVRGEVVAFGGYEPAPGTGIPADDATLLWDGTAWSPAPGSLLFGERPERELEVSFLHTTLGLAAEQSGGRRTDFVRDPVGTLLFQRSQDLGRELLTSSEPVEHFFLLDGVGSVMGLTDDDGRIVASWSYDPFGEVTEASGDTNLTPFRFASAYADPTGLLKMGERYYDPTLGRFTQHDPVWDPLDPKLWNRYVYVGNDPINFVDPSGLHHAWWHTSYQKVQCAVRKGLPIDPVVAWNFIKGGVDRLSQMSWSGGSGAILRPEPGPANAMIENLLMLVAKRALEKALPGAGFVITVGQVIRDC